MSRFVLREADNGRVNHPIRRPRSRSWRRTGQATITADFGGAVGVATLNVDDAILTSIDVAPSNPNIALGAQVQFAATGHFSDGTTLVLTPQVKWESSDATIAVISPTGTTSTAGLGTAAITATLNGVSGMATLTVH